LLIVGSNFNCQELAHGNKKNKPIATVLHHLEAEKKVVTEDSSNQALNHLHVPNTKYLGSN
jgi:hypothetical protein